MKTKYLDKRGWGRVEIYDYDETLINYDFKKMIVGCIHIHKVKSPLTVTVLNKNVKVVDSGFKWLQILPEDKNYSITVMFDETEKIVQYYFDINTSHVLELGNARRVDMYLDVLVLPNGEYELVDEDDIIRALKNGTISKASYNQAYKDAKKLMHELDENFDYFKNLVKHSYNIFKVE